MRPNLNHLKPTETIMKKIIVCLTVSAFVLLPVVEAGEGKTCDKDKTACAEKTKATASASKVCAEKSACCEKQKVARKAAKPDEKGATFLVRR